MHKVLGWAFLLLVVIVPGCTLFTEGVVKKERQDFEDHGPRHVVAWNVLEESYPDDIQTLSIIKSYGSTIKAYSETYGLDWRLVLATMKQESGFLLDAKSKKGASGLMQIMPLTSKEVAEELKIKDMTRPRNNIRGGIFYMKKLYGLFGAAEEPDRLRLTLAAYNAGIGRIYDAQEVAAYFQENPTSWRAVKDALPLLSKRYYTLHRNIWDTEKPRTGWFGNARETIAYVERIMGYYEEYRLALN
jgi:membrane-bound lytic murein transglycosylase F